MPSDPTLKIIARLDDKVTREFDRINKRLTSRENTRRLKQQWVGMSLAVTGAMFAINRAWDVLFGSMIEFEDRFAGVRKTVDATEAEFSRLQDRLIRLSTEIPVAAAELADIQATAGQLGIRGVSNLNKFTETMATIGATTDLVGDQAAFAFARIANVMDEPIQNVDRMAASLVDLGNNAAATESMITEMAIRITGGGRLARLATSDVLALAAAFTEIGAPAQAGGTAVQKALLTMNRAAVLGGEALEDFARAVGLTTDEFIRMQREQPMELFLRFMDSLGDAGNRAELILIDLGLAQDRVARELLKMGSASEILRQHVTRSSTAWAENRAHVEEAEKRFDTAASKLKILSQSFGAIALDMADEVLPEMKILIDRLGRIAEGANTAAKAMRKLVEFKNLEIRLGGLLGVLPAFGAAARTAKLEKTLSPDLEGQYQQIAENFDVVIEARRRGNEEKRRATEVRTRAQIQAEEELNIRLEQLTLSETEFAILQLERKLDKYRDVIQDEELLAKVHAAEMTKIEEDRLEREQTNAKKHFDVMEEVATRTFNVMADQFSDLFFDVFTGQLDSAEDAFKRFGQAIIRIAADIAAQLLVLKIFDIFLPGNSPIRGQIGLPTGGTKAQGGAISGLPGTLVPSFQSGGAVLARLHEGEHVVRETVARRNRQNLDALNATGEWPGAGAGATIINQHVTIMANDAQSFNSQLARSRKLILSILSEDLRNNGETRHLIDATRK